MNAQLRQSLPTKIMTATQPLSVQEIQLYRAMVKSSIVVVILQRLGRPSGASELAEILGIHRETVSGYLRGLAMIGIVTRTDRTDGYRLTSDGQQLLLTVPEGYVLQETHVDGFDQQPHALTLHLHHAGAATEHNELHVVDGAMSENPTLEAGAAGQDELSIGSMSKKTSLNDGKTDIRRVLKREEDIKSKELSLSSSFLEPDDDVEKTDIEEPAVNWKEMPRILDLLQKSHHLFGDEEVFVNGLELKKLDPRVVLSWMAQGYQDRTRLKNPAAMVYQRLKAGTAPKRKYFSNPFKYLPMEYLAALGLEKYYVKTLDEMNAEEKVEEILKRSTQEHGQSVMDKVAAFRNRTK